MYAWLAKSKDLKLGETWVALVAVEALGYFLGGFGGRGPGISYFFFFTKLHANFFFFFLSPSAVVVLVTRASGHSRAHSSIHCLYPLLPPPRVHSSPPRVFLLPYHVLPSNLVRDIIPSSHLASRYHWYVSSQSSTTSVLSCIIIHGQYTDDGD